MTQADAIDAPTDMPLIRFGRYSLSRLILGSNPMNAISHLSRFLDLRMRSYFTQERQLELLRRCQELGINAWQATPLNLETYCEFRRRGGQMYFISLAQEAPEDPDLLKRLAAGGAIAIAHHGGVTDRLWKEGRIEAVHEFCKKVRDTGAMVGVSMHMPVVLDYVESKGWDVDFYMCCVYQVTRSREDVQALLGDVPLQGKLFWLESDPPRMFAAMRQTAKPCLAFKLLAAGRLCEQPEWVERAFESTFRQISSKDAVIVGMYPEFEDQAALDVAYVKRFSHLSSPSPLKA